MTKFVAGDRVKIAEFCGWGPFVGEVQTKLGDSINKGVKGGEGGKGLSSMFSGLTETLSGLFSGLGDSLSGLLSGIGGGLSSAGGGLSSLLSVGMGFLGFSQGGIVPNTATSQIGKDSVPAMLMPGEVVLSKNDVRNMGNNSSQQQNVFNLKVVGNVDQETRRNIVQMMPQIANGVNMQNKERGHRG